MANPWSRSGCKVRYARLLPDRRRRFLVKPLEGREMLSTFTVTNKADTTATGTLRWAITQSNNTSGPNTINFAISGTGVHTLDLGSALPAITKPVTIAALGSAALGSDRILPRLSRTQTMPLPLAKGGFRPTLRRA